jgi:hypothetical protein
MFARVVRWEGGDGETMRSAAADMRERGASGPPEGVPATGFLLLIDPDNERGYAISLFETEDDLRKGDETLNKMDPPEGVGNRASVETYEVGADFRQ